MAPLLRCARFAVVLTLMTACGSSPPATEGAHATAQQRSPEDAEQRAQEDPASKSVCTMMPKAEMETVLGGALTSAEAKDAPGRSQCTYVGFGRYADVVIEWGNGEAGMAGARLAAKFMGATAGSIPVMTPIEGLGDEATLMIGGVLSVRRGADLITVDLRTNKNAEVTGPDIARKIIERM